jgi:hypothetical protein
VEGGDGTPGDGFAVEELLVVGSGFDGVAEGVAEVEDHAQAGLFFVLFDDAGFDADGGGYYVGEGSFFFFLGAVLFGEDGGGVFFEVGEELCIVDDAGLGVVEAAD